MQNKVRKIELSLKLSILFLAMVMPFVGALSGWYYAVLVADNANPLYVSVICFLVGVLLDVICYYENIFSFVFYKLPIPIVLGIIGYELASFFVEHWFAIGYGVGGVLLGVLIDWVFVIPEPFYLARKRALIIVYIFISVIMMGIMVGVPISNFLLGIMAGNYFSLRYVGAVLSKKRIKRNLMIITYFVTGVLLFSEILFTWLIWADAHNIVEYLYNEIGLMLTIKQLMFFVIVLGVLSVAIQFIITYYTSMVMYKYRLYKLHGIEKI